MSPVSNNQIRLPGAPDHLPSGPFEWSVEEWESAKVEVRGILIECAKARGKISYSDLASRIESIQVEAHDLRLFSLLGEVSTDEHEAGRPLLSVLVVHKSGDMQPGPGFFELASSLGRDVSNIDLFWVEEFGRVHDHWAH